MAEQVCNVPDYYEWVKAVSFISSIGFGACTAATLQVASTNHLLRAASLLSTNTETNVEIAAETESPVTRTETMSHNNGTEDGDIEEGCFSSARRKICSSPVKRLGSLIMQFLLDRMNQTIREDHERRRVALSSFAFAAGFYAVALGFSLAVQLLLTWQSAARAVAVMGVVRVMISLYAYIAMISVMVAVVIMGEALKMIKPAVGKLMKLIIVSVIILVVVVLVTANADQRFADPNKRTCVWFTGV